MVHRSFQSHLAATYNMPSDTPLPYTIAHWPINPRHHVTVEEHKRLIATHVVNYLPAFDIKGSLIEPAQYESHLRGAVVALRFTLCHWTIAGRNGNPPSDTFTAHVEDMSVVAEPPDQTVTGMKRKHRAFVTNDPYRVQKKARTDTNVV